MVVVVVEVVASVLNPLRMLVVVVVARPAVICKKNKDGQYLVGWDSERCSISSLTLYLRNRTAARSQRSISRASNIDSNLKCRSVILVSQIDAQLRWVFLQCPIYMNNIVRDEVLHQSILLSKKQQSSFKTQEAHFLLEIIVVAALLPRFAVRSVQGAGGQQMSASLQIQHTRTLDPCGIRFAFTTVPGRSGMSCLVAQNL